MPRKMRVEYPGAIYHTFQRGNNQEKILSKHADKKIFFQDLQEQKQTLGFLLFGYAIMNNHYHILLQTWSEPLHKIMHMINLHYSKYYNASRERFGHVFQGRYGAIVVQDEKYLLQLLRYIHQNPVRAGLCSTVQEYPWSSDSYYRSNLEGIVDIEIILNILSKNREKALAEYEKLMQVPSKDNEDEQNFEKSRAIGDENFQQKIKNHLQEEHLSISPKADQVEIEPWQLKAARPSLDEILWETGVSPEEFSQIKEGSRKRSLIQFKYSYAVKARKNNYSMGQIGNNIQLSAPAIFKLLGSCY